MRRWLTSRPFLSFLGLLALGLLIWFLGPLFGPLVSATARLFFISILLLLWGGWWGFHLWRRHRQGRRLAEALAEEARAVAEEREALQERFREAVQALGRQLYRLPWFAIIGPPGVGKTTLLVNSSLRFALEERFGRSALRGVGGTRNCDWWFAEEAVLLDTAGRYTTHESREEVDRAAWHAFLDLLRKYRPQRPLNGLLVVVSLTELLDPETGHRHALAIRRRIQEIYGRFGMRLPVYLVINKCDLLAGFDQFFSDLTPKERDQVWGVTFPLEAEPLKQWEEAFRCLEARLIVQRNAKLAREHHQLRRNALYLFPNQFASLKPALATFLENAFARSRLEPEIWFRGFYFTSATQEGSPVDRILGHLARQFGLEREALPRFSGKGKAFFINDLLQRVVFPEAGLAGRDRAAEERRQRRRLLALATLLLATFGLAAYGLVQAFEQRERLTRFREAVVELETAISQTFPEGGRLEEWLPIFDRARALIQQARSLEAGLFLDEKLTETTEAFYRRLLHERLLPVVLLDLEGAVREVLSDPARLYPRLRAYLMLDHPDHYDGRALQAVLLQMWDGTRFPQLDREARERLKLHLAALLARRPSPLPRALDGELIEEARAALARRPLAVQLYDQLKAQFSEARRSAGGFSLPREVERALKEKAPLADFVPAEALGSAGVLLFRRKSGRPLTEPVSALFTPEGYRAYVEPTLIQLIDLLRRERWVYGEQLPIAPAQLQTLRSEVLRLYAQEYLKTWQELLHDVEIEPPRNLDHAREILKILSTEASPLKRWVEAVAEATRFGENPPPPLREIEEQFRPLREVEAKLPQLLQAFRDLYIQVDAFKRATSEGDPQLIRQQRQQVSRSASDLKLALAQQPLIRGAVAKVVEGSEQLATGGSRTSLRRYLEGLWRSEVLPFCQKAIAGRYPIDPASPRDITREDFRHFFGPGGILDRFFDQFLAPSVDRSRSPWRWRSPEGQVVSSRALRQFEIAERIRQAFFGASGRLQIRFALEPLSMSPELKRAELVIGSQKLLYEHKPLPPQWFRWPVQPEVVRLHLEPALAPPLTAQGPWAWLRFLDKQESIPTASPEQFLLTFKIGEHTFRLRLIASSVFNPFGLKELHQFRCLPHL